MQQLIRSVDLDTDMTRTLAQRFADVNGRPVMVNGITVRSIYRRSVENGQKVRVRFVFDRKDPLQGLRLKFKDGFVILNDQELTELVVWRETAPEEFCLVCRTKGQKASGEFRVWNCWKAANGVMQAWIGNAGMVAEECNKFVTLKCSPGIGDFDPQALKVEREFC